MIARQIDDKLNILKIRFSNFRAFDAALLEVFVSFCVFESQYDL